MPIRRITYHLYSALEYVGRCNIVTGGNRRPYGNRLVEEKGMAPGVRVYVQLTNCLTDRCSHDTAYHSDSDTRDIRTVVTICNS